MHTPVKKLADLLSLTFCIMLILIAKIYGERTPPCRISRAKPKNIDNLDPHLTQVTPIENQCSVCAS